MRQAYRQEHDSLGELPVPAEAYYGCQTLRALESYAITGDPIPNVQALSPRSPR